MEILQDSSLAKYFFEKYSSNPKNWSFIISTTSLRDGFFDATVSNTDEVWQLKIDSLYKPASMVLGTRIDIDSTKIGYLISNDIAPFRDRKLDPPIIMELLRKLSEDKQMNASSKELDVNNQFTTILGSLEPVRPINGKYAYGPFVYTDRNISSSEYQKQIGDKLAFKLRDNLRKRYSSYG